ncbi:MAG: hypothetical protein A2782_01585 [Candidatus Blackburnbacteria bacterium RIFCSPHIGHO2_01_FULL_43_15b]|uniref:PpiC domain-containing protein n=1 Tax=Candidatus Blackburnbacteria bacterium RIFCSPHIGHO2_01_FULL_43_15b TaxID=1797513 RepID=A0A1G1UXF9_9BACT|nr:MAG: hypothetical protein A2782_01585 [Candidatus Blackburnbacteria bacterium RIFCSPHIGHO2_01_FULL_43_15b]
MAAKTRTQTKSKSGVKASKVESSVLPQTIPPLSILKKVHRPSSGWVAFWALVLFLLALSIWKRNWVLAATVYNKPVWGFEVLNRMDKNYREAELQAVIDGRVIMDEAAKRNAVPAPEDVKNRFIELENRYGGADTFKRLLAQQGQSRESFESTLKLQLAMEKMYSSEINITEQDIDNYVKENKNLLIATDAASQRQEAKQQLTDQKQQEVFSQKFAELKQKANVRIF